MTPSPLSPSRRGLLRTSTAAAMAGLATAGAAGAATAAPSAPAGKDGIVRNRLRFREDGTFTLVQFNDTQDGPRTDRRTIQLQEAVLDDVQPDFALINGDVINGSPTSALEAKQAINNVVRPMEDRGIPWALTFGNHDEDSTPVTGLDESAYIDFVRQYPHNLNTAGARGITGNGNQVLGVRPSRGGGEAFALWLLDSGRYAPEQIAEIGRAHV